MEVKDPSSKIFGPNPTLCGMDLPGVISLLRCRKQQQQHLNSSNLQIAFYPYEIGVSGIFRQKGIAHQRAPPFFAVFNVRLPPSFYVRSTSFVFKTIEKRSRSVVLRPSLLRSSSWMFSSFVKKKHYYYLHTKDANVTYQKMILRVLVGGP